MINKIGAHVKNYALVMTKYGSTIMSYIKTITGNLELSKDVFHKTMNFMSTDKEGNREAKVIGSENNSVYSGKNYSGAFLSQMTKHGLKLSQGIEDLEERFLAS